MPRDAHIFGRFPATINELVRLIDTAPVPLGVQGIDSGGSAAILHPDGRIICAVQAPIRILSMTELERCRPGAAKSIGAAAAEGVDALPGSPREGFAGEPRYWQDAWISFTDLRLGEQLLTDLTAMVDGVLLMAPKVRLDNRVE